MSFDIPEDHELSYFANLSQSLSSRAMSFDIDGKDTFVNLPLSQSLSSRAMSFDVESWATVRATKESQSLSSRAMSFDTIR